MLVTFLRKGCVNNRSDLVRASGFITRHFPWADTQVCACVHACAQMRVDACKCMQYMHVRVQHIYICMYSCHAHMAHTSQSLMAADHLDWSLSVGGPWDVMRYKARMMGSS